MYPRLAVALSAAALLVALAFGPAPRVSDALSSESCSPPVTMQSSEITASVEALERHIAANIAPLFRRPGVVEWSVLSEPTIRPGAVTLSLAVGEDLDQFFGIFLGESREYEVKLTRECSFGQWEVASFKLAKGQKAPPRAGAGVPQAVS